MSLNSQYVGAGSVTVAPGVAGETVMTFLGQPGQACNDAWLLAYGGTDNNGPLRLRLYSQNNQPLSDEAQVYGNIPQRTRFFNVNIPASTFPPVVKVVASNDSTNGVTASLEGVMLTY